MDSVTLHSSHMFLDLAHSLKWNPGRCCRWAEVAEDGVLARLRPHAGASGFLGQATVLGIREYSRTEAHSWVVRLEQVRARARRTDWVLRGRGRTGWLNLYVFVMPVVISRK